MARADWPVRKIPRSKYRPPLAHTRTPPRSAGGRREKDPRPQPPARRMTRDETLARALPAIGERARLLSAENAPDDALDDAWTPPPSPAGDKATPPRSPAVAPALSPSSSSRASSVSSSSSRLSGSVHHHHHHGHLHRYQRRARREGAAPSNDMSPQPLLCAYNAASADVRPVRRRFLSSDVVAKPSAGSSSVSSNPRFLSPVSRLYAASTSSVSLRRWVTAKASAVRGGITRSLSLNKYPSPTASGDERASSPCSSPSGVVSPVRLRTRSDNYLLGHTRRSNAFAVGGELFPVQAGVGDSDSSDDDCGSQISSFDNVENAGDIINIDAAPVPLTSDEEREKLEKLHNLQLLLQEGFITVTEYKDRHVQLVGEPGSIPEPTISKTTDLLELELPIIYHEPPDFSQLRPRDAIKHVFDSVTCKWTSSRIQVKIDPQPFARGGLRQVFHLQDLSASKGPGQPYESYVAKVAINPNENPDTYFRDVEMQAVAAKFAKQYNSYNPPRRVEFLEAWILQLIPPAASTNGGDDDIPEGLSLHGTICGVEPFIAGEYHKHNNNFGYVSELERNTPQAFSHFTYEASGEQILVVDIQGVGDHYTDPQIHTRRGKEFGKGNLSVRGFARFLGSHRCNPICRYLKLTLINPKHDDPMRGNNDPKGTVPAQTYMSKAHVDKVDSVLCHYYTDSKAFQRYRGSALNRSGSERSRGQPLPPRRRRGIQEENKIEADEAENASIGSASNAERRLTTKLLLQDLRIDRSCSFFFCGADQQCSIS